MFECTRPYCDYCDKPIEDDVLYVDIANGPLCFECAYEQLKDWADHNREDDETVEEYIEREMDAACVLTDRYGE